LFLLALQCLLLYGVLSNITNNNLCLHFLSPVWPELLIIWLIWLLLFGGYCSRKLHCLHH
jgi:hypothetical protein